MRIRPLLRDEVRSVDSVAIHDFGVPGIVLMENASRGAAEIVQKVAPPTGPITILCGKGNNAGDGYAIARHLELAGRTVKLISVVDLACLSGDALTNLQIVQRSNLPITRPQSSAEIREQLLGSSVIVDCLLGTGARGALRGLYRDTVEVANECECQRIAIDLPTGVDCDSGEIIDIAFRADHTITFVAEKVGMLVDSARDSVGQIHVVGIGAPREVLLRFELQ